MKKVIEQDFFLYIGDIEVSTDSDGDIEVLQWNKNREGGCDIVTVGKSKAREAALSIDPTIEADLKQLSIEQSQNEMLIQELHEKDKEIERLKEFEFMYNELKKVI